MADAAHNYWRFVEGRGPVIATAIHDGHEVRPEVSRHLKLADADRLREEDPHTGNIASVSNAYIVARRSRFEVDLNRPREKAVYMGPESAWGLDVWKEPPTQDFIQASLVSYDAFYEKMSRVFTELTRDHGAFVALDVHSYNHRRNGPGEPPEDPGKNPEVNIGTGTMDRPRWASVVDRFIAELAAFELNGRQLDVRENVKFFGGNLARWTHTNFPDSGCVLAIEFRKSFMDEWSGEVYEAELAFIKAALESTLPGITEGVARIGAGRKRGSV